MFVYKTENQTKCLLKDEVAEYNEGATKYPNNELRVGLIDH